MVDGLELFLEGFRAHARREQEVLLIGLDAFSLVAHPLRGD